MFVPGRASQPNIAGEIAGREGARRVVVPADRPKTIVALGDVMV
jgi:hypothetical protein